MTRDRDLCSLTFREKGTLLSGFQGKKIRVMTIDYGNLEIETKLCFGRVEHMIPQSQQPKRRNLVLTIWKFGILNAYTLLFHRRRVVCFQSRCRTLLRTEKMRKGRQMTNHNQNFCWGMKLKKEFTNYQILEMGTRK